MTCSDVQVYLGDAVDRFLPKDIERAFHAHLGVCTACRNAFELEKLSKQIVRERVRWHATPPQVYSTILSLLHEESLQPEASGETWFKRFFTPRSFIPALGGGLALVIFLLFFSSPQGGFDQLTVHTASNDVINRSYKKFLSIRDGELKPSMVSCFPESVLAYFEQQNPRLSVKVLNVPNSDWYGAIADEYGGVKLAHVVYKLGDEIVYVFQANQSEVLNSSSFSLPPAALSALKQSGWYTDPGHPDCSVVVWIVDETLCTAVSTMKKDRLLAMLTTP